MQIKTRGVIAALVLTVAGLTCAQQPSGWTLRGRVLDDHNRPIAGARVQASFAAAHPNLGEAQVEATICSMGEDGRFILPLPYRDVVYSLVITSSPTSGIYPRVLAAGDDERIFRVRTSDQPVRELTGTLVDREGRAIADTTVELIGEYGFRMSSRTEATGAYRFMVPEYIGQSIYLARADSDVARSEIFGSYLKETPTLLKLREPATISGVVTCIGTDKPIAGATVSIRTEAMNDFRMHATTDDHGRYEMSGVPAGEYLLEARAEEFFSPPTKPPSGPKINLSAGDNKQFDLQMEPRAIIRGVVVDAGEKPVSNAMVGMRVQHPDQHHRQHGITWTDETGLFRIATSWLNSHEQLHVFHGRLGARTVEIGVPSGGETLEDVSVQLAGTMRLSGMVVDTTGKPLENITCVPDCAGGLSIPTDSQGRFDLGFVPARQEGSAEYGMMFRSPRPSRNMAQWILPIEPAALPDRTFQFKRVTFNGEPGKTVTVRAELEEAEIITIKGRIVDQTGNGIPDAAVALMAGHLTDEQWARYFPTTSPSSSLIVPIPATSLGQVTTDERGEYEFKVVRENTESMALLYGTNADPTRYTVCTYVSSEIHAVETNVRIPEGQREKEVTIRLNMPGREQETATLDG